MEKDTTVLKELHSIKKFRGSKLGVLRLNKLANPDKGIIVRFGGKEFLPISFDTYGHPIVSEQCFAYYKALKSLKERQGGNLVPEVEYIPQVFVLSKDTYDSKEAFEKIENLCEEDQLKVLKDILVYRKKANFTGKELNIFILYGKYALYKNGHIYKCKYKRKDNSTDFKVVMDLSEVTDFELLKDKKTGELIELHIPGPKDRCSICGKKFTISDVKAFATTEDYKCEKVHSSCLYDCNVAINYQEACAIVKTVYQEDFLSEIIKEYDEKEDKERIWYKYHTTDGDLAIRFKPKVIEIKFFGNFKPFNLEVLFKDEDVTKKRLEDAKIIHAWGFKYAIKYLSMVADL